MKIDHIDLSVSDFEKSKKFYNQLFHDHFKWDVFFDQQDYFMVGHPSGLRIGISPIHKEFENDRFSRYRVGVHHFAIELDNKEAVDKVYEFLNHMGAEILDGPAEFPNYDEFYYAVFYVDPDGIKHEFVTYNR